VIAEKSKFHIGPLKDHERAFFCCGTAALDRYIREQASQDVRRGLAAVFVIVPKDNPHAIAAYYTLSRRELKLKQLPPELVKKAGRYEYVGVTLLGRLAVAETYKGTGLGALTLLNALDRSLAASREVASWAVFVDALDGEAARFYRKYGFLELPENELKPFLPMKAIQKLFSL
jgi:GNAT superfamily N-acetyltransferase